MKTWPLARATLAAFFCIASRCMADDAPYLYPVTYTGTYTEKLAGAPPLTHLSWGSGYISASGEIVIRPTFNNLANRFSEGIAAAGEPYKFVLIDKQGHTLFDSSTLGLTLRDQVDIINNRGFHDGLFVVIKNEKWGFIDQKGNCPIPLQLDHASDFHEGFSAACLNKKWGYIRPDGSWLVKFEDVFEMPGDFSCARGLIYQGGYNFFVDTDGNKKLGPYVQAHSFSDGLAWISNSENLKGYIRKIDQGESGFIDTSGKLVLKSGPNGIQFGPYTTHDFGEFKEGLVRFRDDSPHGKWGYANHGGEAQIKPTYEDAKDFSEGLAAVKIDGRWGFIDPLGNVVIKPIWFGVEDFHGPLTRAELSNSSSPIYIDRKGSVVWDPLKNKLPQKEQELLDLQAKP